MNSSHKTLAHPMPDWLI